MSYLYRPAWLVVLVVALATSWWSLYSVAVHYAVPAVLAAGVSAIFDGAAIVVAALCQRYAATTDSGIGPRLFLLVLLAGSVLLNVQHARLAGYGLPAMVLFAAPACVAIVLFELEQGFRNREHRRAVGRVVPALPMIGRWGWLFYPARSLQVLRAATREHLQTLWPPEGTGRDSGTAALSGATRVTAGALTAIPVTDTAVSETPRIERPAVEPPAGRGPTADRVAPPPAAPGGEHAIDRPDDPGVRPGAAAAPVAPAASTPAHLDGPPVPERAVLTGAGARPGGPGTEALNVVFAAPTDHTTSPDHPTPPDHSGRTEHPTPPGHERPVPATGRSARAALADHPAGRPALVAVPGRRRLAELPSDAARARLAAATLGTDRPGEIAGWLAEQGHPVAPAAIRSALRRRRTTDRPSDRASARTAAGDASG